VSVRSDPEQEPRQKKEQINEEDEKGKIAHGTRLLQNV
jgi:hypothetical protein